MTLRLKWSQMQSPPWLPVCPYPVGQSLPSTDPPCFVMVGKAGSWAHKRASVRKGFAVIMLLHVSRCKLFILLLNSSSKVLILCHFFFLLVRQYWQPATNITISPDRLALSHPQMLLERSWSASWIAMLCTPLSQVPRCNGLNSKASPDISSFLKNTHQDP